MATSYTRTVQGSGIKATVQRIGGHLAAMVMPNLGAFMAFGLIAALFTPNGWLPGTRFEALVDPMKMQLLPVLIGYTGGRAVHGQRGAVVGAVATVGLVVGSDVPMFLGAMIIGPLTAYLLRSFDRLVEGKIKAGFEMLAENFSAGILGGGMAVLGMWIIGPAIRAITDPVGNGVTWIVTHHLLPFASILIEPLKVLFLNNAINHGVLDQLGMLQVKEHGKSVLFMLETNPGPGLGILLAYLLFGPRTLRPTVPAAIVIQFLGGIHEIYFPYVLMKPRMILAAIAGGASGTLVFLANGAGLVATPSPGSIFAYAAMTPPGGWFGVFAGVAVAAGVSFTVGSMLLGFGRLAEPRGPGAAEHVSPDPVPAANGTAVAPSAPTLAAGSEGTANGTSTTPAPTGSTRSEV